MDLLFQQKTVFRNQQIIGVQFAKLEKNIQGIHIEVLLLGLLRLLLLRSRSKMASSL